MQDHVRKIHKQADLSCDLRMLHTIQACEGGGKGGKVRVGKAWVFVLRLTVLFSVCYGSFCLFC